MSRLDRSINSPKMRGPARLRLLLHKFGAAFAGNSVADKLVGDWQVFDGSRLRPVAGEKAAEEKAGKQARKKMVVLVPPLVSVYCRSLPPVPVFALLSACDSGLLWRQLFPDHGAPLGWRRSTRHLSTGQRAAEPAEAASDAAVDTDSQEEGESFPSTHRTEQHRLCAAFSAQPVAVLREAVLTAADWPPHTRLKLMACAARPGPDAVASALNTGCIALGERPQLFSPLPVWQMRGLLGLVCALWLAAAALLQPFTSPAILAQQHSEVLSDQLNAERGQIAALQQSLDKVRDYLNTGQRARGSAANAGAVLRQLAAAAPTGTQLQRLYVGEDLLRLQGVAASMSAVRRLVGTQIAGTSGAAVLTEAAGDQSSYAPPTLEQMRALPDGRVSFSLVVRRPATPDDAQQR